MLWIWYSQIKWQMPYFLVFFPNTHYITLLWFHFLFEFVICIDCVNRLKSIYVLELCNAMYCMNCFYYHSNYSLLNDYVYLVKLQIFTSLLGSVSLFWKTWNPTATVSSWRYREHYGFKHRNLPKSQIWQKFISVNHCFSLMVGN